MNRAIDIGSPFGCWTYVRECHWGERSAVYMVAHVKDSGRVAALKICTDTDEESVRAFRREISNTRLRLLPGRMPEVLDEGERDGMPYYVMTFGEDVDVECKSEKTAVSVALFLIECCIELRKLGYVHGDLKPENVGVEVGPDGTRRYVLRDWATLRTMREALFMPAVVGSPYYRAKEADYEGVCDERTEIHSIGMTFLALLPLVRRIVYGPAILLAISPRFFPFVQVRTYEELRRKIAHAPGWFRRLVWLKAAIWKTSIVTRWTVLGVTCVVAAGGVMFGCHLYDDYKARHAEVRRASGPKDNTIGLIEAGVDRYRSGDLFGAYRLLKHGRMSLFYNPADFKDTDVEGIFEDCRRRVLEAIRNGR